MLKINKLLQKFTALQPHTHMLNSLGFETNTLKFNPTIPQLYQIAIAKIQQDQHKIKSSQVSSNGAFCTYSSKSKIKQFLKIPQYRIVRDKETDKDVNWNHYNLPMDQLSYNLAEQFAIQYLNHKGNCIVVDGYAGWDINSRLKVRTFCGKSYHALFMNNMLIKPTQKQLLQDFSKGVDINIFNASQLAPTKYISGMQSAQNTTAINLQQKNITILGNQSAQVMKKALFKLLQYYYPRKNILPLHASATIQKNGNTTIFCGLEQSQKTTLGLVSSNRKLIGLDQIAWGNNGIFNIQGGCYTKLLNSNNKVDVQVQNSIRYGTLVQNAIFYPNSRNINFYDIKQSPNAKTSFPLNFMKNAHIPSIGKHPNNIVFFTCDTHGVLPPIAKLTPEQALYHYLSGYTCKINAKDKNNCIKAPQIKFESCFGEQYLAYKPTTYAKMLYDKIKTNNTQVWLVNTGWTQGKYGLGYRIDNEDIQNIINSIIQNNINKIPTFKTQYFNFQVPVKINGIQQDLFYPERAWPHRAEFDESISKLVLKFTQNYLKKFKGKANDEIAKIAQLGAPSLI